MFFKSFLALAALLALVQFSVALHADKPGVSLRRSTPPLAKRSLGKPITKPAVPAARRNLAVEARALEARQDDGQCEADESYCNASEGCCPLDGGCCGNGCIDKDEVCCGDYSCSDGESCCGDGGCAPDGGECCGSGYCEEGTHCIIWEEEGEEEKPVCCEDRECSEYDGEYEELPSPKGSGSRIGGVAGLMAVPVAAAAWL